MAKQKKKRNKQYSGVDARVNTPNVIRVSAAERNRFQEWWFQYGKLARAISIVVAVVAAVALTIAGIIGLVSR